MACAEGDEVRAGDVIAEIETDKATMEVEAVDDGRVGKILVAEGTEHVPVNTPIALLLTDGEDGTASNALALSGERSLCGAQRLRVSDAQMAKIAEAIRSVPQSRRAPWRTRSRRGAA